MEPFISTDDLEALLGEDIPDPDALIVKIALDAACQTVRTYIGQDVNYVAGDVEVYSGSGRRKLRLRQRPVRSVSEVKVDDVVVDPTLYNVRGAVITYTDSDSWMHGNDNIYVTYSHGWDILEPTTVPVPADIRLVALLLSRRIYSDVGIASAAGGVIEETIGDYSYKLSDAAASAMLSSSELVPAEKMVLDKYRIQLTGDTPTLY